MPLKHEHYYHCTKPITNKIHSGPEFSTFRGYGPHIRSPSLTWRPKLNRWAINNPCTRCAQSCDHNSSWIHSWRISHHLLTEVPGHHSGAAGTSLLCLRFANLWPPLSVRSRQSDPPISAAACASVLFGDSPWWHTFYISLKTLVVVGEQLKPCSEE